MRDRKVQPCFIIILPSIILPFRFLQNSGSGRISATIPLVGSERGLEVRQGIALASEEGGWVFSEDL